MNITIVSSNIFTGNPDQPWAEAMRIKDDRIVAIGTNTEIKDLDQEGAEVLELPGRLVTPGFVDCHTHFINLGLTLRWIDLNNLTSLQTCREKIRQAAQNSAPGEWIIGRGWNHHLWDGEREPNRCDLDDITPHNPAMMIRTCGHSVWVNSLALKQAGVTCETPEPPGGKIDRDESGNPTGILRAARHLVDKDISFTKAERKQAALAAQHEMLRFGITGLRTMEKLDSWEILSELDQERQLHLRVYHLLPPQELEEATIRGIRPGKGSEHLWCGQVKLFADGSLGADTALLYAPYLHQPENYGIPYLSVEKLCENAEKAHKYGYDVAIHAIGDKAVRNALEAISCARKRYPGAWRDSIEHVQLFHPQDLHMFQQLGVTASMQPKFISSDWQVAMKKWGAERCQHAYALKTMLSHNIPLQLSSDTPVETCNPLEGLYAAVTRQTPAGDPPGGWFPEQCLTLEEGIRGYTSQHARTSRREHEFGMLSPGRKADVTVFSQDLFTLAPLDWLSVDVELTIVNGAIVYQRDN